MSNIDFFDKKILVYILAIVIADLWEIFPRIQKLFKALETILVHMHAYHIVILFRKAILVLRLGTKRKLPLAVPWHVYL